MDWCGCRPLDGVDHAGLARGPDRSAYCQRSVRCLPRGSARWPEADVEFRSSGCVRFRRRPRRLGCRRTCWPATERRRSAVATRGSACGQERGCPWCDPGAQPPAEPCPREAARLHGGIRGRADGAAIADPTAAAWRP